MYYNNLLKYLIKKKKKKKKLWSTQTRYVTTKQQYGLDKSVPLQVLDDAEHILNKYKQIFEVSEFFRTVLANNTGGRGRGGSALSC